jgi:REP element-mobilizing transposase RayT
VAGFFVLFVAKKLRLGVLSARWRSRQWRGTRPTRFKLTKHGQALWLGRGDLFTRPDAAESFCHCSEEACESFGWLVHAFSIIQNHFHLALETPEPNLSLGMQWLQGT